MPDQNDLRDQAARALYTGPTTEPPRSGERIADTFVAAVYRASRASASRLAYERADAVLPVLAAQLVARDAHIADLKAKLAAVRGLHTVETHYIQVTIWDPYDRGDSCDHCDALIRDTAGNLTANHFTDDDNFLRCRVRPRRTCTHCLTAQEEEVPWPCPTIEVIGDPE
jgi:hypothetical protein